VQYHDETPGIVKFYTDAEFERSALPRSLINFEPPLLSQVYSQSPLQPSPNARYDGRNSNITAPSLQHTEPSPSQSSPQSFTFQRPLLPARDGMVPSCTCSWNILIDYELGEEISSSTSPTSGNIRAIYESPDSLVLSGGIQNPIQAIGAQSFPFSDREAELIRNFSENLALWVRFSTLRLAGFCSQRISRSILPILNGILKSMSQEGR
jgi:hypothetical protein